VRILITGGSGTIGGYVLRDLTQAGHSVTSYSRTAPRVEGAGFIQGDIMDPDSLGIACRGHDAVIHLRFGDIAALIPESEREHWLAHLVAPAASRPYLQMTLQPGACHDDGELREWTPEA